MSVSALVCMAPGSEETEAVTTHRFVGAGRRQSRHRQRSCRWRPITIVCSRGVKLLADMPLVSIADQPFNAIVLPGGMQGAECFRDSPLLVEEKVRQTHLQGNIVAAICAALALVLQHHDLFLIGNMASFPGLKSKSW